MGFSSRMDCCGQFVKYSLFIANFVIFVSIQESLELKNNLREINNTKIYVFSRWVERLCFVSPCGLWWIGVSSMSCSVQIFFSGAVYVLLVTSIIICLVSFLGCVGAGKEVKCLLLTVSKQQTIKTKISFY